MDDATRERIETLEAEVRTLRDVIERLESDLMLGVPSFRPHRPSGLEIRTVQIQTGCSPLAARGALLKTRGDLPAALEHVRRLGLASE